MAPRGHSRPPVRSGLDCMVFLTTDEGCQPQRIRIRLEGSRVRGVIPDMQHRRSATVEHRPARRRVEGRAAHRPGGQRPHGPAAGLGVWLARSRGVRYLAPEARHRRWAPLANRRAAGDRDGYRRQRAEPNARTRVPKLRPHRMTQTRGGLSAPTPPTYATGDCRGRPAAGTQRGARGAYRKFPHGCCQRAIMTALSGVPAGGKAITHRQVRRPCLSSRRCLRAPERAWRPAGRSGYRRDSPGHAVFRCELRRALNSQRNQCGLTQSEGVVAA
jgi:hypothetical protein